MYNAQRSACCAITPASDGPSRAEGDPQLERLTSDWCPMQTLRSPLSAAEMTRGKRPGREVEHSATDYSVPMPEKGTLQCGYPPPISRTVPQSTLPQALSKNPSHIIRQSLSGAPRHTHTHHTHTPEQDPETAHPEIAPFRNASCAGVAVRREQPWVYGGRGRGGSPPIELTLQWSLTLDRIFRLSWRMWRTREPV